MKKPDYMAVYSDRTGAEICAEEYRECYQAKRIEIVERVVRAFGEGCIVYVCAVWL